MSLILKVPVEIKATKYETKNYSYDNLSRLTGVMRGTSEEEAFSYDAVGNRLSDIVGNTYSYNNANELINYGNVGQGFSLAYDTNGNLIEKVNNVTGETTTYTYNSENQLIRIDLPDSSIAEYKYDPFGRRIEKSITDTATGTVTITRYVYDREDILYELDANGNIVTEYLHGPGIDEPIAMIRGRQTYYYHADALGSIIAITDSFGRVVQRYEYDSFGNITFVLDPNFIQPYTYTAREYDPESGMYYYRARYYDPKIGRFVSEDPIGFAGGDVNLYAYVGNSPINFVDPLGFAIRYPPFEECRRKAEERYKSFVQACNGEKEHCLDDCERGFCPDGDNVSGLSCEIECNIRYYRCLAGEWSAYQTRKASCNPIPGPRPIKFPWKP